jgi:PKD repeat protein
VRAAAATLATTLVALGFLAASAVGAGWVAPVSLPGVTAPAPQATAVTRAGWVGAALQGATAGTEQVLIRAPSGVWTPATVTGVGTSPQVQLALSERGDAVLAVANAAGQVLVFGHVAGANGFVTMGTVLSSGYAGSSLGVVALENGTAAVMAGTATDLLLATGPIGGALSSRSVLPAGTNTPKFPHLLANPRGDALLLLADHDAATTEQLDGLRRAPGGDFVATPLPLDTIANGINTSGEVVSAVLNDAGAAEITWLAQTAGPSTHLRAGHLPAGASALSTPLAGRDVRTTAAGQSIQGPLGAVPLPGDSGAGLYAFVTPGPVITIYDITHAGAAGAYTGTVATGVSNSAFTVMPEPGSAGGFALMGILASNVVAFERQPGGTYVAGPPGLAFSGSIGGFTSDGADSIFAVGSSGAKVLIFDASPPVLAAPSGPATAVAGTAATFSASAGDASGPPSLSWTFGDGATATGASVSHAWSAPGTYTIGVTATDTVGQRSATSAQIVVSPAPAHDTTAPKLTKVKLSPATIHRRKLRTTLKLTLSEAARVTATVTAKVPGHRSGKKCLAGKRRKAKRCTAAKTVLTVRKTLSAGSRSLALKLPHSSPTGALAVKVSATDAAGNKSGSKTLKLTVRR